MKFLEIINKKKLTLIAIFSFVFIALNLIDGERGLISYYEKPSVARRKKLNAAKRKVLKLMRKQLRYNKVY